MAWVCYMPAGLLALAAAGLPRFGPAAWARWAAWAAMGLTGASVAGTLLVLVPLYHNLAATGFTPDKLRHLAALTRTVQLAPAGLLALDQLHGWLRDTRPVARWVFIGLGVALDPATAFELRQLRATNRRQAKELDMLERFHKLCTW